MRRSLGLFGGWTAIGLAIVVLLMYAFTVIGFVVIVGLCLLVPILRRPSQRPRAEALGVVVGFGVAAFVVSLSLDPPADGLVAAAMALAILGFGGYVYVLVTRRRGRRAAAAR